VDLGERKFRIAVRLVWIEKFGIELLSMSKLIEF
jgi:hypothetical protein